MIAALWRTRGVGGHRLQANFPEMSSQMVRNNQLRKIINLCLKDKNSGVQRSCNFARMPILITFLQPPSKNYVVPPLAIGIFQLR